MNCSLGVNAFRPGVQVAAQHFTKARSRLLAAAAPTTRCFSSTTLLPFTAQNQWQANRSRLSSSSTPLFGPSSISRIAVRTLRIAARNRILVHYVDLPPNYKDEEGLPFRANDLVAGEVLRLFGPQMSTPAANKLLRILHGRRVAGTLEDPVLRVNTAGYTAKDIGIALNYLRKNVYVDEVVNAGLRAEDELAALEKQQEEGVETQAEEGETTKELGYTSRFKMYKDDVEGGEESEKKKKPASQSVYGNSAFDAIRARNEAIWKEKLKKQEEERKKLEEEYRNGKAGPLAKAEDAPKRQVSAKRKEWEEWAMSDLKEPPKMPAWKRLLPSTIFVALVVAGMLTYSHLYVAPSRENRLWPDCPPAAATIAVLIGANALVWFLWKIPIMWKPLLRYFLITPATPKAFSMLGAVFSHQAFWGHLALNSAFLWFFGTRLHDEVGRADFLTTYIASGTLGFLTSLFWLVLKGHFHMTTLGASCAIYGISTAYLWMHRFEGFKIFGLPPDPYTGVQGMAFIGLFGGLNVWGLISKGHRNDVVSHLGGMLVGIIAGHLMEQKKKARLQGAGNTQLNLKDQKTGSGVLDNVLEKK